MVNYSNGKIYKIEPIVDYDEGDIYIGSTTKEYLSQRMDNHRGKYKRWKKDNNNPYITSFKLFEKYGIDNCEIILIETCNCNTKDELHSQEAKYIKSMKCANKVIPTRTNKQYKQDNKEELKQDNKDYYELNKVLIKEKRKKRYDLNKVKISETQKEYYNLNREKILLKTKEYYKNKKNKKELEKNKNI